MKVILLKELPGKGGEGDVIEVARGFANNFLLRQGYAVLATKGNLKQLEDRRKNIAKREEVRVATAEDTKSKLEAAPITIAAKVGDEGQLFGSVTSQMVADAIAGQLEVEVDRRRIEVSKAIKQVGEHEVSVSLYREIRATVKLSVVDAEAPAPAAEEPAEAEAPEAVEAAEEAPEAPAAE
ncbi:50S ribosomal protein L9 [Eggerthellaceae bacterium zg-1084]|uniref:Large ribosomal subunit protein bL9 n=1 Tax=Berryella wangjianweii TaxID=2734634 RepID=A0A6M8J4M6_9ACTN|nr:50S ribosomal protein L9 [Berryella wangjianweii]NPD30956.1 50S ribosomal protein L9 [Berryella wangjianweii]NPD31821.1 50S ribosomal protein L9 [Eggerthellaceae bacterium zg-997]QKF07583.1 50S ribosomal protein L9 [Berryella wangjianweii]